MTSEELDPIRADRLAQYDHVIHGFFTRNGGISSGIFRGLNVGLGSSDEKSNVVENRRRVARWFGASTACLSTPYQVHSANVITLDRPLSERPQADAIVTRQPGLPIGILTADCGPVLFFDNQARIAGAAHAGWKGATGGVLENTIDAMEAIGATRQNISAVLGPMISQDNYEIGPDLIRIIVELSEDNQRFLRPSERPEHAMFNLAGYVIDRLERAGVHAEWTGHCTYADEDRFFSYRRKTHRDEPDYGRQISAICIRD